MKDSFYHVFTEYEDNSIVTYGFFKSLKVAYTSSVEWNEKYGNNISDYPEIEKNINDRGIAYVGCHIIKEEEFSD